MKHLVRHRGINNEIGGEVLLIIGWGSEWCSKVDCHETLGCHLRTVCSEPVTAEVVEPVHFTDYELSPRLPLTPRCLPRRAFHDSFKFPRAPKSLELRTLNYG